MKIIQLNGIQSKQMKNGSAVIMQTPRNFVASHNNNISMVLLFLLPRRFKSGHEQVLLNDEEYLVSLFQTSFVYGACLQLHTSNFGDCEGPSSITTTSK